MTALPALQFLSALGLFWLSFLLRNYKKLILGIWLILILINVVYLYHQYFRVFPVAQSEAYQYGLNQALPYVVSIVSHYRTVIVSNERNLSQSYMFYLYWSKFDPVTYLRQGGTKSGGFAEFHVIGKYNFRPIHWHSEHPEKGMLYVGNTDDFPAGSPFLKIFKSLDGTAAVQVSGF